MSRLCSLSILLLLTCLIALFLPHSTATQASADKGEIRFAQGFQRYVDELPIPQVLKISRDIHEVTITMNQFKTKIHRDLPDTLTWGYNGSTPGPTIEVRKGHKLTIHWKSELPTTHLLKAPKMMAMSGEGPMPDVRNVVHLHGAVVTEINPLDRLHNNDGWPDAWIVPGQEQIAEYPNPQKARILWYHDHAIGETGRNVAAGLEGMYIIHDAYEKHLNLPSGKYDVPLIIQSKGLNGDGSLYYTNDINNEFYGNSIAVNGKLWPFINVEPRKYRFRILNASNARSYALKLADSTTSESGPEFYQIGTDSGFLENTVKLNDPALGQNAPTLLLMPAERADVIIDFSKSAGKSFLMQNNALPDAADSIIAIPQVMLFKVGTVVTEPDTSDLPMKMRPIRKIKEEEALPTHRVIELGSNEASGMMLLNKKSWTDPIEDKPVLGTTEVWDLVNTLVDHHPFHVHLVQFQVLDRRPFDFKAYVASGDKKTVTYTGPAVPPDDNELGWKDTIRTEPFTVTRIIMKFAPYTGFYVYHCHILEHEDMDMMRPFEVVAPGVIAP